MRAIAVPSGVRAAALKTLQHSSSSDSKEGESASIARPSRVISLKTNVRGASHITLLEEKAAATAASETSPRSTPASPRSPRTARSAAGAASVTASPRSPRTARSDSRAASSPRSPRSHQPAPQAFASAHSSSQTSLSTLGVSPSTEDLVSNLMSWVEARKTGKLQGPAPVETPPEQAVEATRSLLLLDSASSIPPHELMQDAPASTTQPETADAAAGPAATIASSSPQMPAPLRRAGSMRGLSSSHAQSGEETVLVDLRGLRRYDTWGFCDCVLGSGVEVRDVGSSAAAAAALNATASSASAHLSLTQPSRPHPSGQQRLATSTSAAGATGSSIASVSRATRMQQQANNSAATLKTLLDPPFERRCSPLYTHFFSRVENMAWRYGMRHELGLLVNK
jgi:hypothetical protein